MTMFEMKNDHLSLPFHWYKKLSISLLFEIDNFFLYPDQGSPSTLGANARKISLKSWMIQMPDVERWCEKWSSKSVQFTPWKKKQKWEKVKQENAEKRTKKEK